MDWLAGPRLKLARSQEQIAQINMEMKAFTSRPPHTLVGTYDRNTREGVVRVAQVAEPDPVWSVRIGEIVHDLRSSLEHVIWNLVEHDGGIPKRGVTGLPVCMVRHGRHGYEVRAPRMLGGITNPQALATITHDQPFMRPDPYKSTLYVLNALWNTDKHRTLHLCQVLAQAVDIRAERSNDTEFETLSAAEKGTMLEDGAEIVRWRTAPGSQTEVKVHADIAAEIGFAETDPQGLTGASVSGILGQSATYVSNFITNAEAFFT